MAATKTKTKKKNAKAQAPAKARKGKAEFPRIAAALAAPLPAVEPIPELVDEAKEQTSAPKKEKAAKLGKKMSALDAAAQVLRGAGGSMNCKGLIEAMATQELWKSPGGKTPEATLYAAILREITVKGAGARFKKADRGQFTIQ